ncbi:hypothetical protein FEM48_ZijujUnG0039900 [Ziziphus jujuba var. spinosa]|uniref:F-box domain-containing protein n=1 Tax=Ziziphus jujuba var. spinosa TaxID=714518 RepID=A0A978U9B6_ZIZJJ|nr:hypothetical protein FEM48_ZijujUnG0039900 [Ziziphus jujuba var. spinosa]
MVMLTEDLVVQILMRLPAQDLVRLKLVCKSWNSIIKSSSFISNHFLVNQHNDHSYMVIVNGDETRIFSSYNDLEHQSRAPYPSHRRGHVGNYRSYEFCRCRCLCCCECGLMLVNYTDSNVYAMWNPATGEEKLIPNHQNQRQFEVCGIGFDSKNNEYKPFFAYSLSERMEIEMYSFKTNQWRNLVYPPDSESELGIDFLYGYRWIVYANGIAHWEEENDGDEKAKLFLYDTLTQQALDLHIGGINTRVMTCPKTLLPIVSQ